MVEHVCPQCGNASSPFMSTPDRNRGIGSEVFTYYRCGACRLLFLSPVPDDVGRYYPPDYHGTLLSLEDLTGAAEQERYKMDIVTRFVKGGTLLEVGPGGGSFALLARDAGFRVRVIEMSRSCCDYLTRTIGVDTICTSDEARALEECEPADAIALWHVIEHLTDPFDLVRTAARKLVPGGILVMAAPNPAALQFRILRGRWTHVDAPRHLSLIPPDVLRTVAESSGLRLVLHTTLDEGSVGWDRFGWEHSLANMFRSEPTRARAMKAGRVLTRLMRPFEQREGRGSAYTMVFERPGS